MILFSNFFILVFCFLSFPLQWFCFLSFSMVLILYFLFILFLPFLVVFGFVPLCVGDLFVGGFFFVKYSKNG